ncbi:uncharacterized protein CLUP02_00960 [Colletotrichum lupini]|uniref:Secreted protein n=1 Tax=Colletotrichum lupini TaxID=145971 RepID=A0A9Q8SD32_9PEZI|nr:uncharacterized protein CLUP02_00960 [Colletotrichum lupini]KAK1719923.1 hypothetical protein BDP67DRAFT_503182 [Colletotrichum lupini]UQC74312.1 hypothetical protein CLUP02_00960 [Colletotrichum lupini]
MQRTCRMEASAPAVSLFCFFCSLVSRALASRGSPLWTAGHKRHSLSVLRGFPEEKFQETFFPFPLTLPFGCLHHFFLSKPAQTEVMAFWPRTLVPCLTAPTKHSHHTHMNNHDPARQDPSKHAAFVGPRHGRSDRCSEHGSDLRPPSLFPEPVRPPLTIGVCPPGWAGTAGNCAVTQ